MPNPAFPFPQSGQRPDSSKYEVSQEDPAISAPTEGGYEFSRPRFTRAPRKTFKVGYTAITNANKALLVTFWDTVKGGSLIFDWYNHEDGLTHAVRFASQEISYRYVGVGDTKLWDCSFSVKQA